MAAAGKKIRTRVYLACDGKELRGSFDHGRQERAAGSFFADGFAATGRS